MALPDSVTEGAKAKPLDPVRISSSKPVLTVLYS